LYSKFRIIRNIAYVNLKVCNIAYFSVHLDTPSRFPYNDITSLGDGTHHQKRQAYTAKGVTPIEKNIIVVDENGTIFESTWPKRAGGLVKKGRARWLDEKTICLACPPECMEDNKMDKNTQMPSELTAEDLLNRMDAVRKEMPDMTELLETMKVVTNQAGEDDAGHIAEAISQAFVARETTCQQQLKFLETIYKELFSNQVENGRFSCPLSSEIS